MIEKKLRDRRKSGYDKGGMGEDRDDASKNKGGVM